MFTYQNEIDLMKIMHEIGFDLSEISCTLLNVHNGLSIAHAIDKSIKELTEKRNYNRQDLEEYIKTFKEITTNRF